MLQVPLKRVVLYNWLMAEKLVVFDLDGTLLDTLEDIRGAVNYALSAWSVPKVEKDKMREYVGHGLRNALFTALNNSGVKIDDNDLPLMVDLMLSRYSHHPYDNTKPYEGIPHILSTLFDRGVKVGIISNKSEDLVKKIVDNVLPDFHFDFVIGQSEKYPLKPNPESLLSMMDAFSSDKSSTLYIGDSEVDEETARNAGVNFLIVNYGFRTKEELEKKGITGTLSSSSELEESINAFFEAR